VDPATGKLCGILTNRDMRFEAGGDIPAKALMTHENLVTVREGVSQAEARDLLRRHKIERLIVVDDDYRAVGLITVKDMEKSQAHPFAAKDAQGRLLVAAASTVGDCRLRTLHGPAGRRRRRGGDRHRPRPQRRGRQGGRNG
jgi:IMP dehydrogenase